MIPLKLHHLTNLLLSIAAGGFILYFGRPLFIPLGFALLISFLLYPVCKRLETFGMPSLMAILIAVSVVVILVGGLMALLIQQLLHFIDVWQPLKEKMSGSMNLLSKYLADHLNISHERQVEWIHNMINNSSAGVFSMLKNLVLASGISAVLILIVPVYAVLILSYRRSLVSVLYSLFPSEKKKVVEEVLLATIHQYFNFIKGMMVVYIVVGILNSIGLLLLGIRGALLFGFIASILTFIPYVGIMVAALAPITVSWLTYDSVWYPVGVIIIFSVVQYLEANIIYPVAVGNRLHLNTLVIIIAIITGGILWGASGMILFIPFVAILKLVADRTQGWEALSKLLSEK